MHESCSRSSNIKPGSVADTAFSYRNKPKASFPNVTDSAKKLMVNNQGMAKTATKSWDQHAAAQKGTGSEKKD